MNEKNEISLFPETCINVVDKLNNNKITNTSNRDISYLVFSAKTGTFTLGARKEDVTNEHIVVDTKSFMHGWSLWFQNKNTKIERPFYEDLPPRLASIITDDGKEFKATELRGFSGLMQYENETENVSFSTNSFGGKIACDKLLNSIIDKAIDGNVSYIYPLIKLESDGNFTTNHGVYQKMNFKIEKWLDENGNVEGEPIKITADTSLINQEENPELEPKNNIRRKRKVL